MLQDSESNYNDKCYFVGNKQNKDHVSKLEIYDKDPSFLRVLKYELSLSLPLVVDNTFVSEGIKQCLPFQSSFVN